MNSTANKNTDNNGCEILLKCKRINYVEYRETRSNRCIAYSEMYAQCNRHAGTVVPADILVARSTMGIINRSDEQRPVINRENGLQKR